MKINSFLRGHCPCRLNKAAGAVTGWRQLCPICVSSVHLSSKNTLLITQMPFIYETHTFIPINDQIPTGREMPPSPPCHRWDGDRKQLTDPKQTPQRHTYSTHVHPRAGRRDLPSSQHKHSSHTRSLHGEGCSTVQRESMPISKKSHWGGGGRRGVCLSAFTALGQICQNSYVSAAYDENWCGGGGGGLRLTS